MSWWRRSANARLNPVYGVRVYGFEERLGVPLAYVAVRSYSLLESFSALATGRVPATTGRIRRWVVSAACAVLVFGWLIGLRRGLFLGRPGWLAWLAVSLMVFGPLWWVSRVAWRPLDELSGRVAGKRLTRGETT